MNKLFWMSFCDADRPKGQHFLGVSIVPVSQEEVDALMPEIIVRFTHRLAGVEWLAVASRKAHEMGCNPGGEVQAVELEGAPLPDGVPLCKLMSKADLEGFGLI